MIIKEAESICGTLSKPSKMPCYGYSIPAKHCKIGMKMRNVKDSICSVCYAMKGRYGFPNVLDAMERRFQSLTNPLWVDAMVTLIGRKEKSGFFRWHDSGDVQSIEHLKKIADIAQALPNIQFWLPTREYNIVKRYQERHWPKCWTSSLVRPQGIPRNLTIRLSGLMLDGLAPNVSQNPFNLPTSGAIKEGFDCPASEQGNKCLDCRLCWSDNGHVNYKKH